MTLFSTPTFVGPATPQDQPARQIDRAPYRIAGNPLSDNTVQPRDGRMTHDQLQAELDIAYQNMMAARTETGERYWCERLKYWVALAKQPEPETA